MSQNSVQHLDRPAISGRRLPRIPPTCAPECVCRSRHPSLTSVDNLPRPPPHPEPPATCRASSAAAWSRARAFAASFMAVAPFGKRKTPGRKIRRAFDEAGNACPQADRKYSRNLLNLQLLIGRQLKCSESDELLHIVPKRVSFSWPLLFQNILEPHRLVKLPSPSVGLIRVTRSPLRKQSRQGHVRDRRDDSSAQPQANRFQC